MRREGLIGGREAKEKEREKRIKWEELRKGRFGGAVGRMEGVRGRRKNRERRKQQDGGIEED